MSAPLAPPVRPRLLEGRSQPLEVIEWVLQRFAHDRIAITTGFGMEGCVLLDLLHAGGYEGEVLYLDTHFLFEQTHELREQLAERYPRLLFRNVGTTLAEAEQTARYGPRLWHSDPDLCCKLRKVEPLQRALEGYDVWLTAIRREQSPSRAETRFAEWNHRHDLLRVAPLAYWSRSEVYRYAETRDVPINRLHAEGYPSIGCTHCTRPVVGLSVDGYSRAGRWSGSGKTECGLHEHNNGGGI